jgi:hypothetical protein
VSTTPSIDLYDVAIVGGGDSDPAERLALLDWLPYLAADPVGVGFVQRRAGAGVPLVVAEVPGPGCVVAYTVLNKTGSWESSRSIDANEIGDFGRLG